MIWASHLTFWVVVLNLFPSGEVILVCNHWWLHEILGVKFGRSQFLGGWVALTILEIRLAMRAFLTNFGVALTSFWLLQGLRICLVIECWVWRRVVKLHTYSLLTYSFGVIFSVCWMTRYNLTSFSILFICSIVPLPTCVIAWASVTVVWPPLLLHGHHSKCMLFA